MIPGRMLRLALPLLLASSFLLSPGAGFSAGAAERWKAVAGSEGEERILYDPGSVVPSGPGRYSVWIMGFDKDRAPRKSLEEFDCVNRIVRDVEVIVERPNRPAAHSRIPSAWTGVARESPRGELLRILCR